MSGLIKSDLQFRIGHVLFLDLVGYSKLLISEQHDFVELLNQLVRGTESFQAAETQNELICLPTGDGMAMVFSGTVETAVECALEIGRGLKAYPRIHVRMGVHSGPISLIHDVNERSNVAGAGINIAQRVMSHGDAGHILLSRHVAEDLEQYPRWHGCLHDLGECEIKHGSKIGIVNCYTEEVGNPQVPLKIQARGELRHPTVRWRRPLVSSLLAGSLLLAGLAAVAFFSPYPQRSFEKSIAVLPFENLSDDDRNAYFAGGIQDGILTNLVKVGDLKVISRTSVMRYQTNPPNVREIGRQLGVGAVLEGSVRREGDRVRVAVQLIDTKTDSHLWAEQYDREVSDTFSIESDLALQITVALRSKLSSTERQLLEKAPTRSGEAYLVYLQGREAAFHVRLEQAAGLFQKAIALDPHFALAFAALSQLESNLYQASGNPAHLEKAKATADEALRLEPDSPQGHLALALTFYRGERDYSRALLELKRAREHLPNEADIYLLTGSIERRQGKWGASIANLRKATSLSPNDPTLWANLGTSYQAIYDFPAAAGAYDRGISADSGFFMNRWLRAQVDIEQRGELARAQQVIAQAASLSDPEGQITLARFRLRLLERNYEDAVRTMETSNLEWLTGWQLPTPIPRALLLAQALRLANEPSRAQNAFEEARQILEKAVSENPTDPSRHALLGLADAGLGRREEALREGKRAVELLPETKDAFEGPAMGRILAQIYSQCGEADAALRLLDHLLSVPAGESPLDLKLDPTWDSLRADPRFEKILAFFPRKIET